MTNNRSRYPPFSAKSRVEIYRRGEKDAPEVRRAGPPSRIYLSTRAEASGRTEGRDMFQTSRIPGGGDPLEGGTPDFRPMQDTVLAVRTGHVRRGGQQAQEPGHISLNRIRVNPRLVRAIRHVRPVADHANFVRFPNQLERTHLEVWQEVAT